jgi:hypothetical protein
MAHWLKRGMDAGEIKVAEANVRETVEGIPSARPLMIAFSM